MLTGPALALLQSAENSATILELVLDGFLHPKESRKCAPSRGFECAEPETLSTTVHPRFLRHIMRPRAASSAVIHPAAGMDVSLPRYFIWGCRGVMPRTLHTTADAHGGKSAGIFLDSTSKLWPDGKGGGGGAFCRCGAHRAMHGSKELRSVVHRAVVGFLRVKDLVLVWIAQGNARGRRAALGGAPLRDIQQGGQRNAHRVAVRRRQVRPLTNCCTPALASMLV